VLVSAEGGRPEWKRRWDRAHHGATGRATGGAAHYSDAQIARMRELRVAGMKVYEIADLMDVCASGVSRRTRLGAVAP
jgi:hypothetical protein